MDKQSIDHLFKRLEGRLDTATPSPDHKASFLAKLEAQNTGQAEQPIVEKKSRIKWLRPLSIAASVVLLAGIIFTQITVTPEAKELADVSPEMQQTQDFFTQAIAKELYDIKEQTTPENQTLVADAITQLELLEAEYQDLKTDLSESGEDKRVIYAMIDNFQNRIDLLQNVADQMDAIKELKQEATIL